MGHIRTDLSVDQDHCLRVVVKVSYLSLTIFTIVSYMYKMLHFAILSKQQYHNFSKTGSDIVKLFSASLHSLY